MPEQISCRPLEGFDLRNGLRTQPSDSAAVPTTQIAQEGAMVGTFQYMSPEQNEGKDVDGRSGIFSMSAALYEMVTGKRAFAGKKPLERGVGTGAQI